VNYQLESAELMLREAAADFLEKKVNGDRIRSLEKSTSGFSRELWEEMAAMGWMGLNVPEAYEGHQAGFMYLVVILEQIGRCGLASPFFHTVALGNELLNAIGSDAQKTAILPRVVRGEAILSVAYAGADEPRSPADLPLEATADGHRYRLKGTCLMVPFAHIADHLICAARIEGQGCGLFLLDPDTPGLAIKALQTSADDRQYELVFDDVVVGEDALLGTAGDSWPVFQRLLLQAAVAKCAELVGGARRALEITVAYSKERVQFGQPIGAFQAVQHHCANMLTYLDTSALITRHVCRKVHAGTANVADMAKCKAWVSDACRKLLLLAHQIYGGMGFMEESDLQIYFRRVKAAEQFCGNASFHREIVARELDL